MHDRRIIVGVGCFSLWGVVVASALGSATVEPAAVCFTASTVLLCAHVLYGGYFLLTKERHLSAVPLVLMAAVYAGLMGLSRSPADPRAWFAWIIFTFIFAMPFHLLYRRRVSAIYLREFCNYKLFVEITGILLCVVGIITCALVPHLVLGVITLAAIIKFNHTIFMKKRLYRIRYDNPSYPESPLVSIIIIAYNEERFIGALLEAVQKQDYPRYEVIVVDDHSRDGTVSVAQSFSGVLPLRVVQKEVRGISRSRNFGATFANGEILLFLDADVVIPPDFISSNLAQFRAESCSVAGVDFLARTSYAVDRRIVAFYRRWLKAVQYFNPRGIGIGLLVMRGLHRKVLFDETIIMSEDFDYIKRAHALGRFRILTPSPMSVSWRRFERENRFILIGKYLFFEWYRQHVGEIRRHLLRYEFGNSSSARKQPAS